MSQRLELPPLWRPPEPRRIVRGICFHNTETEDTTEFETDNHKAYHLALGWSDIGYDFVVERADNWCGVIVGRPLYMPGAHCRPQLGNTRYIGFAFNGNYNKYPMDMELVAAAIPTLRWLCLMYNLDPRRDFVEHRQLADTDCPGAHFDMSRLMKLLLRLQ